MRGFALAAGGDFRGSVDHLTTCGVASRSLSARTGLFGSTQVGKLKFVVTHPWREKQQRAMDGAHGIPHLVNCLRGIPQGLNRMRKKS